MNDALAERSGSLADLPTAPVGDRVRRRVRFRRARRHTLEAGGVTAAVAVLGSATWFGLNADRGQPAPAVSPTVSTPTPSGSPTPAPTPSATATSVVLDELPGLPPTQAMPAGLLEQTGPGWVLTIYESKPASFDGGDPPLVAHTVVLVSPTGDRYRVVDLPLDQAVYLLRWDAGSTTAVVSRSRMYDDLDGDTRAVLDLTTGTMTATEVGLSHYGGGPFYVGRAADGAELWTTGTSTDSVTSDVYRRTDDGSVTLVGGMGITALLDPTGRWLVNEVWGSGGTTFGEDVDRLALLDVVHGGSTEFDYGVPGKSCAVVGWIEPGALLTVCSDPEQDGDPVPQMNATLFRLDVSDGSSHATELKRYADDEPDPVPWSGAALGDGRVAFSTGERGYDGCMAGVEVWDGDRAVPLQDGGDMAFVKAAVGGVVYVEAAPSCQEALQTDLTAHDLASGSSTVLAPELAPTADVAEWAVGLRTWAVAGDRAPAVGW